MESDDERSFISVSIQKKTVDKIDSLLENPDVLHHTRAGLIHECLRRGILSYERQLKNNHNGDK